MVEFSKDKDSKVWKKVWWGLFLAAVVFASTSGLGSAGTSRPFRYYTDSGNTAFTYYTNASGNVNNSYWGINTDNPQCELDINGTICIGRAGYYYGGVNLTGGAPASSSYIVATADGTLTNERVITSGKGITLIDTGANGILQINVSTNTCTAGNYSTFNGTQFVCSPDTGGSGSTYSAGNGLNLTGTVFSVNGPVTNTTTAWGWNGTAIILTNSITGPQGSTGTTGSTGPQGPGGANGTSVSLSNGIANYPAVWINSTNITANLINATMLNVSTTGSSGQVLTLNSTGGMNWTTSSGTPFDPSGLYANVTAVNSSLNLTIRKSIMQGAVMPDTSGNVWFEPAALTQTNDLYPQLIARFKDTATNDSLGYGFTVPNDYVANTAPQICHTWTTTATVGNVTWNLKYNSASSTSTLDPVSSEENLTVTTTVSATSQTGVQSCFTLTASKLAANDYMQMVVQRAGNTTTDNTAADTTAYNTELVYNNR